MQRGQGQQRLEVGHRHAVEVVAGSAGDRLALVAKLSAVGIFARDAPETSPTRPAAWVCVLALALLLAAPSLCLASEVEAADVSDERDDRDSVVHADFTGPPRLPATNEPVMCDASASRGGTLRYEWDLDGNGDYETDSGAEGVTPCSFEAPGKVMVGLRVTAENGGRATVRKAILVAAQEEPRKQSSRDHGSRPSGSSVSPDTGRNVPRIQASKKARASGSMIAQQDAPPAPPPPGPPPPGPPPEPPPQPPSDMPDERPAGSSSPSPGSRDATPGDRRLPGSEEAAGSPSDENPRLPRTGAHTDGILTLGLALLALGMALRPAGAGAGAGNVRPFHPLRDVAAARSLPAKPPSPTASTSDN